MKIHEYNEMMRYLTRPAPDPSIKQQVAKQKPLYGTSPYMVPPSEDIAPMPNIQDLIREEGIQVGPQVKDGGRIYDTRKYFKPGGLVEPGVTHYAKATVDDPGSNVTAGQELGDGIFQRTRGTKPKYMAQHGSTSSMKEKKARVFEYFTLEEAKKRRKELIETYGEIARTRPEKQKLSWEKMNADSDFEEFFKKEIKENPNIKKVADKYNLGENNLEELFNKVRDEVNVSENLKKGRASAKGRERLIHPLTLRRLNVKFVHTYKPSIGNITIEELAKHSHLKKTEIAKLLASADRPPVDPLFGKTAAGIGEESTIKRGKYFKKVLEDIGITVDKRATDPKRTVRNITDKRIGRYVIKANPEQLKKLSETQIFKKIGEGVPVRQKDIYSSLSKTSDEYIKFGYSQDRTAVTELATAINRSMDAMSFNELANYIKNNKKLRDLVELSFDGVNGTFTKVPIDDMTEGQLRQFSKMEADHIRGRATVKFDDATRKILSGLDIEYPRNLYIIPKGINQSVKQKVERWVADYPEAARPGSNSPLAQNYKNIEQKFKDAQISYWNKNTGSYGGYQPKASAVDLTHMDIELEELLNKHTTYKDVHGVERAVIKDKDLLIKKVKALNEKRIPGYLKIAKTAKGSGKVKAVASLVAIGGGYLADKLLKEHGISLTQDENEKVLEAGMLPNIIKEHPVTSAAVAGTTLRASKRLPGDPLKVIRKAVHTPVTWPLKKIIRSIGTPLGGAGFAGWQIYDNLKAGESIADAVVDPVVGAELALPSLFKENISKIIPDKYQNVAARAGRKVLGLGKVGSRFMGPVGIGIGAAGSVYDAYKDYERRKPFIEKQKELIRQGVIKEEEFDKNLPMFNTGGRVPFVKGKLVLADKGRRAFMKWLAGITGAGIAAGTGLIKFGKIFGKGETVIKAGDHIIQGTPGMPDWYIPLINRIVKEGDDVTKKLGTVEREIVHTKKIAPGEKVTVYQNMDTGNVRVEYGDNLSYDNVHLEYKAPEEITSGKHAGKKTDPEFSAAEPEPEVVNWDGDIEWSGVNEVNKVEDLVTDTNPLKQFAKKKKPTMKDIVESSKKNKYQKKLQEDTMEQVDYIEKKRGPFQDPEPAEDMFDEFGNYIGD